MSKRKKRKQQEKFGTIEYNMDIFGKSKYDEPYPLLIGASKRPRDIRKREYRKNNPTNFSKKKITIKDPIAFDQAARKLLNLPPKVYYDDRQPFSEGGIVRGTGASKPRKFKVY
tara:strand:+ start:190 stop:531 length:342 start_codon:yes stop_codon:yes gene_type:complete